MSSIIPYLVPLSVFAVFVVLVLGLYTMMQGKSPNLSQTLMRWRVGLQFVAIVVIMAAVFIKRSVS
jgi:Hypoxia induced protein conserved region